MSLPIIFIHKGYSDYMEYSLRQAKYSNPDSEIILIGDEFNNRFDFVKHVDMKAYFQGASDFADVYTHYSTNPYGYELFCFQRWFILEDFMKNNGYKDAFICDTDVMLYSDINNVFQSAYKEIDIGLMIMEKNMSIGISYQKLSLLQDFLSFLQDHYVSNKSILEDYWEDICRNKQLGGYSDMIAVTEFVKQLPPGNAIVDLLEPVNDEVFDRDINNALTSNEPYQLKYGKKRFIWDNGIPYGFNTVRKKNIKFHLIHFQGPAKYMISSFYRGPVFKNKYFLDIKFKFLNMLAFIYIKLKIRYRFSFLFNYLNKRKKQ